MSAIKIAASVIGLLLLNFAAVVNGGEPPSRVVLLGDSTVITSYLPKEAAHTAVLQKKLDERYGPGAVEVINWADNGEFIARFLFNGSYEKFRTKAEGADLFLLRFGINDAKRYPAPEFAAQLEKLLGLLHADFPDARFVLETGVYADPAHFAKDRNKTLNLYWDQTRRIAGARQLPLCDIYLAMEQATRAGNWDLRIRMQTRGTPPVLDASQDEAQAHLGKRWFTDIHPNPEGVRVAADAEAKLLFELFPQGLPRGGGKTDRPAKSIAEYETFLGVTKETLKGPRQREPDALQAPVQP